MHVHFEAFSTVLGDDCRERILARDRSQVVADCRRILAAQLRSQHWGFRAIGDALLRHHSTIIHLVRSHKQLIECNDDYRALVDKCALPLLDNAFDKP
jgi:chromosomal replication initiation ATPase DnaA